MRVLSSFFFDFHVLEEPISADMFTVLLMRHTPTEVLQAISDAYGIFYRQRKQFDDAVADAVSNVNDKKKLLNDLLEPFIAEIANLDDDDEIMDVYIDNKVHQVMTLVFTAVDLEDQLDFMRTMEPRFAARLVCFACNPEENSEVWDAMLDRCCPFTQGFFESEVEGCCFWISCAQSWNAISERYHQECVAWFDFLSDSNNEKAESVVMRYDSQNFLAMMDELAQQCGLDAF
eukprot:TRINITY_DN27044_c0_g1_i1.p1 TRINITY_DN27044_c0_g1~~TRINITY_DN27044_c0_g1_i1.p1  ORF type:complete len:232 (+),score=42.86 TRINITY_DN27044_c0_g1_i1:708-1403(+)